jgi:hypothetical protein
MKDFDPVLNRIDRAERLNYQRGKLPVFSAICAVVKRSSCSSMLFNLQKCETRDVRRET